MSLRLAGLLARSMSLTLRPCAYATLFRRWSPASRRDSGVRGRRALRAASLLGHYSRLMSARLDKSWSVLASHQTPEGNRCVDIFSRPDGTYWFEEFRKDPEDVGAWTPVNYFAGREYRTDAEAVAAARQAVSWLGPLLDG